MSAEERRKLVEKPLPTVTTYGTGRSWAGTSRYSDEFQLQRYRSIIDYEDRATTYENLRNR